MKTIAVCLFLATMISLPVYGSDESEMNALARIHQELAHVSKMVIDIKNDNKGRPDDRIRFRYDALLERIMNLQRDIQLHMDWVNDQPKMERFNVE